MSCLFHFMFCLDAPSNPRVTSSDDIKTNVSAFSPKLTGLLAFVQKNPVVLLKWVSEFTVPSVFFLLLIIKTNFSMSVWAGGQTFLTVAETLICFIYFLVCSFLPSVAVTLQMILNIFFYFEKLCQFIDIGLILCQNNSLIYRSMHQRLKPCLRVCSQKNYHVQCVSTHTS